MKIDKDAVLYSAGLLGVVASGVAAVRSPAVATFSAFFGTTTILVCNYLWPSSNAPSASELKSKTVEELRNIAKRYDVKDYASLSRGQLVRLLAGRAQYSLLKKSRWPLWKWLSLLCGVAAIAAINVLFPDSKVIPPKLELAWYQNADGKLSIVDPQKVNHELSIDDVFENRLQVPINLAIRNIDKEPLEVVRVELGYGSGLNVLSGGRAKIDPTGHRLIYEHNIGTLERVDEFTPLEPIDTISVPFHFIKDRFVTLSRDEVPLQVAVIVGQDVIRRTDVVFNMRVFCKDRPVVEGIVKINLSSGLQLFTDIQDATQVSSQPDDAALFSADLPFVRKINSWSRTMSPSGKSVEYELLDTDMGVIQRVAINGVIRRVAIDKNKSGLVDFILFNPQGEKPSIIRMRLNRPWPLIDWPSSEVQ